MVAGVLAGVLVDVKLGLRQVRNSPRFFGLLFAILVIGIGSTTAMFSITRALIRPLPYPEPERLLLLAGDRFLSIAAMPHSPVSLRELDAWKQRATTLEQVCVASQRDFALSWAGQPVQGVIGARISGDFFPMLGLAPQLGRLIGPEEAREGAPPSVVLGAAVWRRRFGGDPSIVGQSVLLDGRPHTVLGVAPDGFDFAFPGTGPVELWTPIHALPLQADERYGSAYDVSLWHAMGRRRASSSPEQVGAELSRISADTVAVQPGVKRPQISALSLKGAVLGDTLSALLIRFGGVALVFLAICANASGLLASRAETRRGEFAARAAFGATRARLLRQVLTETLLLFSLAAPPSALAASLLVDVFRDFTVQPSSAVAGIKVALDRQALWFCLGASLFAGLLAGWVPALSAARTELSSVLQQASARTSVGGLRSALRNGLVVIQVALAFALTSSAGSALLSLVSALRISPGFELQGLVSAQLIGSTDVDLDKDRAGTQLLARVMERLWATPGVQSVAANEALPLSGYDVVYDFEVWGEARPYSALAVSNWVTPGYFETMGIPMLQGRGLLTSDTSDSAPVAVVSQQFAQKLFRGENPVGRYIRRRTEASPPKQIVGIVGDVHRFGLLQPAMPEVYTPLAQEAGSTVLIVARTEHPARLVADLPGLVASVDPRVGVSAADLREQMRGTLREPYQLLLALGTFSAVALLLAMLGLYALVSYATASRTREFGIRTALGSSPAQLSWLIMRSGLLWLGLGCALGFLPALALGKMFALATLQDLRVHGLVALSFALAGAVASFIPARRALRASPAAALRYE